MTGSSTHKLSREQYAEDDEREPSGKAKKAARLLVVLDREANELKERDEHLRERNQLDTSHMATQAE
ncbi:hypothetical protein [Nocardiopsis sp. HUAS JQ3]|uniref:hypothetical protein n=1 Tax=Nocardiopsis sp. HUAS JQ3 TaxID=3061629 RepID=UPI0023A9C314|nr:hypothetical protein [Nocardiopsis sp. HUAS JQ3]WDZ91200.1 hypothetical protein PV789_01065 [Nocardiopsis sp. HUAS JQ3]